MASTMTQKYLCLLFGGNEYVISTGLKVGLSFLLSALKKIPDAAVRLPCDKPTLEYYATLMNNREPNLPEQTFAFMDGLNVPVHTIGDPLVSELYFNGWLQGYFCSNVFLWAPDGSILMACLNFPGLSYLWTEHFIYYYNLFSENFNLLKSIELFYILFRLLS